jgi:IS4 transposase
MSSKDHGLLTDHVSLGALMRIIPRYVVDEVLAQTGKREKRTRLLPAHVVVYFVVALSVFTDGYEEVIRKLVNGLRFARIWSREWTVPSTAALSGARKRLGEAPLKALYERVAEPVAKPGTPGAWLRHWRVMAIDGVMIDMPDTGENRTEYGNTEPDDTVRPFPQIRVLGLAEVGTHAVVDIRMGNIYQGERVLAGQLTTALSTDMLVTADRGFYSFELFAEFMHTGCALLWRLASTVHLPVLKVLPDGSYLSEIHAAHVGRTRIPAGKVADIRLATHIPVRVVEYQIQGHTDDQGRSETFRLITTILDPDRASATELAHAYQQRWEEESAFREIEIYLRDGKGIRSKHPELVRQEIYGLFLAHYAIRAFMVEAADTVEMDPDRLSFTRTLNIVRRRITDPAAFSPLRGTHKP